MARRDTFGLVAILVVVAATMVLVVVLILDVPEGGHVARYRYPPPPPFPSPIADAGERTQPQAQPNAGERPVAPPKPAENESIAPANDPPPHASVEDLPPTEAEVAKPVEPEKPKAHEFPSPTEALRQVSRYALDMEIRQEHTEPTVEVQHILIGFVKPDGKVTVPGKSITRTQDEAMQLVASLMERASRGEDFGELVKAYTNDSSPGIYGMFGGDEKASDHSGKYSRIGMVPAFGAIGWKLYVGEIGLADYHETISPYGYHIIKRLK